MPTYLCHGFRWHRPSIRYFSIVHNLDDVSPDWLNRPGAARAMTDVFHQLFPFVPATDVEADAEAEAEAEQVVALPDDKAAPGTSAYLAAAAAMRANIEATPPGKCPLPVLPANAPVPEQPGVPPAGVVRRSDGRDDMLAQHGRSAVKLLEEYDAARLDEPTRPHAYVADYVARIDLSVSVVDEMARYERLQRQRWQRREHEHTTKDGPQQPSMAGVADEGPAFATIGGSLSGDGGGGGNTPTPTKPKTNKTAGWLELLRDELQRGEEIRWYIVVNNDEKRAFAGSSSRSEQELGESGDDDDDDDCETEDEEELLGIRQPATTTTATTTTTTTTTRTAVLRQQQEAERERLRRQLRLELTGDPDILTDDLTESETGGDDDGDGDGDGDDNDDDDDDKNNSGLVAVAITAATARRSIVPSAAVAITKNDRPKADMGRPRGATTTATAAPISVMPSTTTPLIFPLRPPQDTPRPHTSAAPRGPITNDFLSSFPPVAAAGSSSSSSSPPPPPPQLVLSSPSRQLPQRQSRTPNFSTPHSPPAHQQQHQIKPMQPLQPLQSQPPPTMPPTMPLPPPPVPPTPPVSATPAPPLRTKKSFDLRASGLRRLFGRSKHDTKGSSE